MILIISIAILQLFSDPQPIELGKVHWLRNLEEAKIQSSASQKPILILFQEVPGCSTCKNYGQDVLSHPLLVEAIETYFVPLAIYNNKGGHDETVLKMYKEPAWNNPVVRIVDAAGKDLKPRLSGNYSALGLTEKILEVIISQKGKAPAYLQLLADELQAEKRGLSSATYSMYCFWTGEALFGKLNGVIKTTAGWQDGREVVKVEFDPSVITRTELDKIALRSSCKAQPAGQFKTDTTPKYYLSNSKYKSVPMMEIQKCRVNSALDENQRPEQYLSPRQQAYVKNNSGRNLVMVSIRDAWMW